MAEALGVGDHAQLGRRVESGRRWASRRRLRGGGHIAFASDLGFVDELVDVPAFLLFSGISSAPFETDPAVLLVVSPPAAEPLVSVVFSAHLPRERPEELVASMRAPNSHVFSRREEAGSK